MRLLLRQLDVFLAIAQASSLTQAAEHLCMTKSAVSQTLSELERQLGCALFDRHHGRLSINAQGQRLVPLADEIHARVDDIGTTLAGDGEQPSLVLGASRTIAGYLLPPLLARFQAQYGWMPRVVVDNTQTLQERLLRFECDLAMVEGTITHSDLMMTPWQRDTLAVLCAADHEVLSVRDGEDGVPWQALEHRPWVLREPGSGTRDQYERHIRPHLDDSPRIVLEMASFDAIMASVAEGLGLTFGSTLLIQRSGFREAIRTVPLPDTLSRQLSLCHHRSKYLSAAARQWMTFVTAHAAPAADA
ncbi:LysR family transcriptional regulator [Zymobacter sp. IVIA_12111.31 C1]|uniref:LysR family transcriptional regulator n=1 Tax=Zymobacter sp. IVIA_12111.31 C1 TaxID=3394854 RepID=UPI0039C4D482